MSTRIFHVMASPMKIPASKCNSLTRCGLHDFFCNEPKINSPGIVLSELFAMGPVQFR